MSERVKNANIDGNAATQLQSVPGGPSVAAIAATNAQAQNAQASKNYVVVEGSAQASNEFPYVPFAPDPYDNIANIKHAINPAPTVVFEKEDAEYLLRQRAQVENADYDRWVMQKYDLSDPAQNFLMQQIAPDQFQRRLDLIDYQQALVSKYARIRLLGAKSQDDLRFEWLVETGRIQLPAGPIWDPVTWMENQYTADGNHAGAWDADATAKKGEKSVANRARFQAGLFNPLTWTTEKQVGFQPNFANPSDIRGTPDTTTIGQLYTGSDKDHNSKPYKSYGTNPIVDKWLQPYDQARSGMRFGEPVYGGGKPYADRNAAIAATVAGPGYGRPTK